MFNEYYVLILFVIAFFLLLFSCIKQSLNDAKRYKQQEQAFLQRPSLSKAEFYQRYFQQSGISEFVVLGVIEVLEQYFSTELAKLQPDDLLYGELTFLFDSDSLADVEMLCALEEKFNIHISSEQVRTLFSIHNLIILVANNLGDRALRDSQA